MGVKRIILIGMLFPLLFSCREEYISDGEHRTEMFVIINSTSHVVNIEDQPFDRSKASDIYEISVNDSILIERTSYMHDASPFTGIVFISFDNEDKSICTLEMGTNVKNVSDIRYYKKEKIQEDYFISRYTITEEDYEYAKAHPYLPKQESEE